MARLSPLAPHVASAAELQERLQAEASGAPFLVLRDGDDRQVLVALGTATASGLTVGRREECDVALPWDPGVSRLHAQLERLGGDWVLVDDGLSANGTYVGADRVVGRRRLMDGDLVRVGDTLIAYCAPRDAAGATAMERSFAVAVSPAQRRVLVALCAPFLRSGAAAAPPTNTQLAGELVLSVDAIKTHLRALFTAFDLDDAPASQKRALLVERAIRTGSVTARDLDAGPGAPPG